MKSEAKKACCGGDRQEKQKKRKKKGTVKERGADLSTSNWGLGEGGGKSTEKRGGSAKREQTKLPVRESTSTGGRLPGKSERGEGELEKKRPIIIGDSLSGAVETTDEREELWKGRGLRFRGTRDFVLHLNGYNGGNSPKKKKHHSTKGGNQRKADWEMMGRSGL